MDVVVIGFDACLSAGYLGAADMLKLSAAMITKYGNEEPFDVVTASADGSPIIDSSGRRLAADRSLAEVSSAQAVIVPGYLTDRDDAYLASEPVAAIAGWLRRQHALGARICGSCSGVFLLGEAGLLDERRCTTTWWRHDELRSRYPRAEAVWGAPLIEDRRIATSGGPLSWIDLCLFVVRALRGVEAAKIAADFAVIDTAPATRAAYMPASHVAAANPFLLAAEHAVRQAGESAITVQGLARTLGASERTLNRRLKALSGESPREFINRIRFEIARTLLETTACPVKQLAATSGYADEAAFRRAFYRHSGMTPGAYRARARRTNREP